jgi:hypothetical protein
MRVAVTAAQGDTLAAVLGKAAIRVAKLRLGRM